MTVLVTGASGHLGANLVRRLLDDGHAVRVLLRQGSNNTALDGLDVERTCGDLRDPPAVLAAVRGCEHVYHCAARVSTAAGARAQLYASNVLGTRHLLRAAQEAGVSRVVVTGSFSAVGHHPRRPSTEDDPFNPFEAVMPYEHSKMLVEHECLKAVADGLDVVIATSCAIIGPNDFKPSRMGRVLLDFANGKLPAYMPGGFEFVATRDIVEGHLLAMGKGRRGHKYIFSSEFITMDRLMGLFEQATGRRRPRLRLPAPLMVGVAEVTSLLTSRLFPNAEPRFTPGAVRIIRMCRRADCGKAKNELGYQPTSIARAVGEAYACFVRRGLIRQPRRPA